MKKAFWLAALAYLVPTFPLGYFWHLTTFRAAYDRLEMYRPEVIIPFGFLSMLIQAAIFAWVYERAFANGRGSLLSRSLRYGAVGALLSWSFTTLAVAAKNVMASVPDYIVIETAFTIVQWALVAPLTVLSVQPRELSGRVSSTDENPMMVG